MLNREGPGTFSLRRLSRQLGVSHAAAYRHFRDKEALLSAIVMEASRAFAAALEEAVQPGAEGEEALMQLGVGYVRFFLKSPEILPLFSVLPRGGNLLASFVRPLHPGEADADAPEGFALFRRIAREVHRDRRFTHLTEGELLLGFWAKVHGLATILVTQPGFLPEEDLEDALERVVRTAF